MYIDPLTLKIVLDRSSPENVITANRGALFFRKGYDDFYVIENNVTNKLRVKKKLFALDYQNQSWFNTVEDSDIIFSSLNEVWLKKSGNNNSTGWVFYSNKPLNAIQQ